MGPASGRAGAERCVARPSSDGGARRHPAARFFEGTSNTIQYLLPARTSGESPPYVGHPIAQRLALGVMHQEYIDMLHSIVMDPRVQMIGITIEPGSRLKFESQRRMPPQRSLVSILLQSFRPAQLSLDPNCRSELRPLVSAQFAFPGSCATWPKCETGYLLVHQPVLPEIVYSER